MGGRRLRRYGHARRLLLVVALLSAGCGSLVQTSGLGARGSGQDGLGSVPGQIGRNGGGPEATGGLAGSTGPSGGSHGGPVAAGQGSTGGSTAPNTGGAPQNPGGAGPGVPTGRPGSALAPLKIAYTLYNQAGFAAATGNTSVGNDPEGNMANARREMSALVRYANATGGIAGRNIAPPTGIEVSTADLGSSQTMHSFCVRAAEDDKVDAFIDRGFFVNNADVSCFASHHVTLVSTLTVSSEKFLESKRPYGVTTKVTIDRAGTSFVDGLQAAGWFTGATVGVIIDDFPETARIYDTVIGPRLKALGVNVKHVYKTSANDDDPGAETSSAATAAFQFHAEGVDHVFFFANFLAQLSFTNYAESQRWHPRYGWSDYNDGASQAGFYVNSNQNNNSVAVSADLEYVRDDDHTDSCAGGIASTTCNYQRSDKHLRPAIRRCLDILTKYGGVDSYLGSNRSTEWNFYCDHFLLWLESARKLGSTFSPPRFDVGLRALGKSYVPVDTYQNDFSTGRLDGASSYRAGVWNGNCTCWVATTPWTHFS